MFLMWNDQTAVFRASGSATRLGGPKQKQLESEKDSTCKILFQTTEKEPSDVTVLCFLIP